MRKEENMIFTLSHKALIIDVRRSKNVICRPKLKLAGF